MFPQDEPIDPLIAALRVTKDAEGLDLDLDNLPELTAEEKAALDSLGEDLVERLLAAEAARWSPPAADEPIRTTTPEDKKAEPK